ncbi:VOC family protein [Massilia sp. YIM B04103]|uniref:VOC family protein n=1 Tax=Massilia sp. YIM B04103 TaxID=2963106 RepID=UPI00210A9AC0|nr:VOC family protein [Massilia sp. YIM B04103]
MPVLDHMILRVSDPAASVRFYQNVLGFAYEGRLMPFDVLRVNEDFTLDLLAEAPRDPVHLAFRIDRASFEAVQRRLAGQGIAYGSGPFDRSGGPVHQSHGARGLADAWYFDDPDGHSIEVRTYES